MFVCLFVLLFRPGFCHRPFDFSRCHAVSTGDLDWKWVTLFVSYMQNQNQMKAFRYPVLNVTGDDFGGGSWLVIGGGHVRLESPGGSPTGL